MKFYFFLLVAAFFPIQSLSDEVISVDGDLIHSIQENGVSVGPVSFNVSRYVVDKYKNVGGGIYWDDLDYAVQVIELLGDSGSEGLIKSEYGYSELYALLHDVRSDPSNVELRLLFDVLLADRVLLYAHHVKNGRLDPLSIYPSWNYDKDSVIKKEFSDKVFVSIRNRSVALLLEEMRPKAKSYLKLKKGLKHFVELEGRYDFKEIPWNGGVLEQNAIDSVVPLIRTRLFEIGFLDSDSKKDTYDYEMLDAVKKFQELHDIKPDGVIGDRTLDELNRSYGYRADQIRINMERLRWVLGDADEDFILVNLPGFELYLVQNKELVWETDVMIGSINTKTPVFKSKMKYLVFNPTWTVPKGILRRSELPKLKSNPGYFYKKRFSLFDRSGVEVDASTVDWNELKASNFPYRLVQQPGPENAMGLVKFMFPNDYSVFLHDTPSKSLFDRSSRAFSSGCIRVKNPMELASLLLAGASGWNDEKINGIIESGVLTNVNLEKPIDVLIMYWTVKFSSEGVSGFAQDIYDRDEQLMDLFYQNTDDSVFF